jgi:hypothetical protein
MKAAWVGPQDFDEVKRDYCRKHHITIAQLCARFESDYQLAAELYRPAQAAKQTGLTGRLAAGNSIRHRNGLSATMPRKAI